MNLNLDYLKDWLGAGDIKFKWFSLPQVLECAVAGICFDVKYNQ
jgi:hypothetical protein